MFSYLDNLVKTRKLFSESKLPALGKFMCNQPVGRVAKFFAYLKKNPTGEFEEFYLTQIREHEDFYPLKGKLNTHFILVTERGTELAEELGLLDPNHMLNFTESMYDMSRVLRFYEVNGFNRVAAFESLVSRMTPKKASWWRLSKESLTGVIDDSK